MVTKKMRTNLVLLCFKMGKNFNAMKVVKLVLEMEVKFLMFVSLARKLCFFGKINVFVKKGIF